MGLDMYLYAKEYLMGSEYTRNADGGIDVWDNTNLDTALSAIGLERKDLKTDMPSVYMTFKVADWRKANQIHNWFVENVQGGQDDCGEYPVSRADLEDLLGTLGQALQVRDGGEDPETSIEDVLPNVSGFFFGSQEYDEYYWHEVERTYKIIEELVNDDHFKDMDFSYQSSW
jgi:hypothetical protein